MLDIFNNKLDDTIDSDEESCSISAILQRCNINQSTDISRDSSLCGHAPESQFILTSTSDVDDCVSIPFSSSQPSLTHTYNHDGDSESGSLDLLSNQMLSDEEDTVTPERLVRTRSSNYTKSPEPPIMFANVPTNKIHNRSYAVSNKPALAASISSTSNLSSQVSRSLSRSRRLREIKDRRRFIELKYNHNKHVSLTRAMTPSSHFNVSNNSNNSQVKKEPPSYQCNHKNEAISLKRTNGDRVTGFLLALPFVCLSWILCFLIIYSQ